MVRMKLDDDDFNIKELDVEYTGPTFRRYAGDVPKTGTILTVRLTKAWWLVNDDGKSQMKIIAVAEQNAGKLEEFNGLTIWEPLTWTKENSRRYQPFLLNFDLTLNDIKRKLDVQPDDDNIGTPINSIGDLEIGSDDTLCRVVIKRDFWNDEWRAKIDWDGWLPFDDSIVDPDAPFNYIDEAVDEEADDDEEDEPPARPSRRAARPAASSKRGAATTRASRTSRDVPGDDDDEDDDEEYDDDVIDDDEDDDEEEEAPPARPARSRSSRTAARPARPAARTARTSSDGRRGSTGGSRSSRSAAKPARGRGRAASSDEPPF